MSGSTETAYLTLAGGFVIRAEVQSWLVETCFRLTFEIIDGELDVSPASEVTEADCLFIKAHLGEITAAVAYCDRAVAPGAPVRPPPAAALIDPWTNLPRPPGSVEAAARADARNAAKVKHAPTPAPRERETPGWCGECVHPNCTCARGPFVFAPKAFL